MHSRRLIATSAAAAFATSPVLAEAPAQVRGTITAVDDVSLTVRERDDTSFVLKSGSTTRYAEVVPSDSDAVTIGEYVRTAIKGPLGGSGAVEIVLVPESSKFPVNHTPLEERFEQLDLFWKRCISRPSFKAAYAGRDSGVEDLDKAA